MCEGETRHRRYGASYLAPAERYASCMIAKTSSYFKVTAVRSLVRLSVAQSDITLLLISSQRSKINTFAKEAGMRACIIVHALLPLDLTSELCFM